MRPGPPLDLDRNDGVAEETILDETTGWLVQFPPMYGRAAHRRAAEILVNLAALTRRVDSGAEDLARTVEEHAQALVADPGWFGYTDHTRDGLIAAVSALERAAARRSNAEMLRPWVEAASAAARAIQDEDPFGIQRIRIQDAFRAVVDAFRAVLSGSKRPAGRASHRSLPARCSP